MLLALASFMLTGSWGACAASVEGQHKDGTGLQSCLAPAPLNCLLTFFLYLPQWLSFVLPLAPVINKGKHYLAITVLP